MANPANATLATAVANLKFGNDSNGQTQIVSTPAQLQALGLNVFGRFDASGNFSATGTFDGVVTVGTAADISAVMHEIDEVLGGGGQASDLGSDSQSFCVGNFRAGCYGGLDLYRYSGLDTPSFTIDPNATAYLSVDGGLTSIAGFNQAGGGSDYGDFTGPGNPSPSNYGPCLIQSAYVCSNPDNYTTSSPEYAMMESLGYDPTTATTPLPPSWTMMLAALLGLGFMAYRDARKHSGILAVT